MIEDRARIDTDRNVYTLFWDMHSGGSLKVPPYSKIYIQADEETARRIFEERFGRDPDHVTCNCCGPDYSVNEFDSLAEATAFHRNVDIEDGVEVWRNRDCTYLTNPESDQWRQWGLTEYCLRKDVLVIQTRDD